ncbi:protein-S-isoprenylcysteine O-methyltransferase [Plasmodium gonderi]|uniref:Protein-S-isoprenylcysteine O-methyltransferase n=1 Tax=Plasmodium gonderi TaxID=77519 RepID=A0A1Y1JTK9_PLAGO|nr:protein-S-isoprenylcysteine O-methyltransferase [Plasmodium gonderi]GAW83743.1 protein-S-isoprenylcysteine O-methyltransferase [Plasmodium gonderi]
MNVSAYILTSLLLYISLLNYKRFVFYFINLHVNKELEKVARVYVSFDHYLHIFLEYGFVCIYILIAFQPNKNVYSKRSKYNYIFAKVLLVYFFFFFFHFLLNIKNNFPLNLFYLIIIIFHLSEFFLSFLHNKNNHNYYNFLVNPNYGYVYFFILTLFEYYAKIFLFPFLHIFEKYINKKIIHKLLLVNYFFLQNHLYNGSHICTYYYINQIKINTNNDLYPLNEILGKPNLFAKWKLQNGNQVSNNFLLKKGKLVNLSKKSSFLHLFKNRVLIKGILGKSSFLHSHRTIFPPYVLIEHRNQYIPLKRDFQITPFSTNEDFIVSSSGSANLDTNHERTYAQCLFTTTTSSRVDITNRSITNRSIINGDIIDRGIIDRDIINGDIINGDINKTYKSYDLNNSLFQKIVLKYANIFFRYHAIQNVEKIYNYYLLVILLSLLISVLGMLLRVFALIHCSKNFSFYVQNTGCLVYKSIKGKHKLVTSGLYKYMRHPSYTGWFYYALFLQLSLFNIFSFILCFFISWTYFYRTIKMEEKYLLECYGEEYRKYKEQTPNIYIPFMSGI